MLTKTYNIDAKVWLYPGMVSWHFVTLPEEIATDIDDLFALMKRGWGSIPVQVTIGKTNWKTSIFPDKKTVSYLLPLKAEVRKKENIKASDMISFSLEVKG
jgi:hypothetical protein